MAEDNDGDDKNTSPNGNYNQWWAKQRGTPKRESRGGPKQKTGNSLSETARKKLMQRNR